MKDQVSTIQVEGSGRRQGQYVNGRRNSPNEDNKVTLREKMQDIRDRRIRLDQEIAAMRPVKDLPKTVERYEDKYEGGIYGS